MMKPIVVITDMSVRWSYFQYFLLGFYILRNEGRINLKFRCNPFYILSTKCKNRFLTRVFSKLHRCTQADSYNMSGYILFPDGVKKYFCIDSADAPYLFNEASLKQVDIYFKMQCPKQIDVEKGFPLNEEISVPYCDHAHKNRKLKLTDRGERIIFDLSKYLDKIRPLMVGFRKLSDNNTADSLIDSFENYKSSLNTADRKTLMCYFGNNLGPKPSSQIKNIDYDWESDLMGQYATLLEHPNVKRGIIANLIKKMGDNYDGRIISESYSDSPGKRHEQLIIPLKDFCRHIAKFRYNMNVSGYRMSIPNRFIESFVVGTGIFTDKLFVKWYKPFGEEVVETVEMGYKKNNDINWTTFEKDLHELSCKNPFIDVDNSFNEKWAPEVVAKYIIDTTYNS